jgi:hypothetical protein
MMSIKSLWDRFPSGRGYDAIGVRMTEPPITPERVLKAVADKRAEG